MQFVMRLWFLATGLFLGGAMIWAFAPVLVPVIGLTVMIGALVAGIVAFARYVERIKRRAPRSE